MTPYKLHPIAACLGALLIGLSNETAAAVRRVPSQYATIGAGVQAAAPGDTVLVAPGNYTGQGNSSISFAGKAITVCSEAGPNLTAIAPAVDQSAFFFASGEPPAATVRGFTLRHGYRAIWCNESSPTVINCVFYGNGSYDESGGAFFGTKSSPSFIDCDFIENSADGGSGGAIALIYGNLTLTNCTFTRNVAAGFGNGALGGAVFYDGGGVDLAAITGCTFTDNLATASGGQPPSPGGSGGAMWIASAGVVTDCTFTGNSATTGDAQSQEGYGGAVFGGAAVFARCVFSDNSARLEGGAVKCFGGLFENCTFTGNRALDGGAVLVATGTTSRFIDCKFSDNQGDRGGVLAVEGTPSEAVLEGCLMLRNSARRGGVIHILQSFATLRNCTLFENTASDPEGGGAGVWIDTSGFVSRVTIENTVIAGSVQGQPVTCRGECCFVTMSCTDIFDNAGGDYVDCLSGLQGVDGNISSDPLFCDASNDDFQLNAASPCAPGNSPAGCDLIGALPVACGVTGVPPDQAPAVVHELIVIPNPVRGVARFEHGPVSVGPLNIFDTKGRLVEQLIGQEGHWEWTPGASVPAGVYFAVPGGGMKATEGVKFLYLR